MAYFIIRECACGATDRKEVTEAEFDAEVELDAGGCVSMVGDDDIFTYQVHSCPICRQEEDEEIEQEEELKNVPYSCGYCGSTKPSISPEEMYGPGATGWDCCPDCGGV